MLALGVHKFNFPLSICCRRIILRFEYPCFQHIIVIIYKIVYFLMYGVNSHIDHIFSIFKLVLIPDSEQMPKVELYNTEEIHIK